MQLIYIPCCVTPGASVCKAENHRFQSGPGHASHLLQSYIQARLHCQDEHIQAGGCHSLELVFLITHVHLRGTQMPSALSHADVQLITGNTPQLMPLLGAAPHPWRFVKL